MQRRLRGIIVVVLLDASAWPYAAVMLDHTRGAARCPTAQLWT